MSGNKLIRDHVVLLLIMNSYNLLIMNSLKSSQNVSKCTTPFKFKVDLDSLPTITTIKWFIFQERVEEERIAPFLSQILKKGTYNNKQILKLLSEI